MGEGMEVVRGAGGPWTVATDPQRRRWKRGVKCAGGLVVAKRTQMDKWEDRNEGKLEVS